MSKFNNNFYQDFIELFISNIKLTSHYYTLKLHFLHSIKPILKIQSQLY